MCDEILWYVVTKFVYLFWLRISDRQDTHDENRPIVNVFENIRENGDSDIDDIFMLVILSWRRSVDVGDIFWILVPNADVKR